MADRRDELVKRIGDEESDAKGHERHPGDDDEDVARREGHEWQVPKPDDSSEDEDAS